MTVHYDPETGSFSRGDDQPGDQAGDQDIPSPEDIERITFSDDVQLDQIIEDKYCRPVKPWRVVDMMENWDAEAVGALYVSLRADGRYAILDGNHRRHAAMLLGIKTLPARVFIDLTYEREAGLFDKFNTQARGNAMDNFRARIQQKDPQALAIQHLLEYYGLRVGTGARHDGNGTIFCIRDVERIYTERGADALSQVVRVLTQAWSGRRQSLNRMPVVGTSMFLERHGDDPAFSEKRLIEKLRLIMPEEMTARAKALQAGEKTDGVSAFGRVLVSVYNANLRDPASMLLRPWLPRVFRKTTNQQRQRVAAGMRSGAVRAAKAATKAAARGSASPTSLAARGFQAG
jgi:hypothetical protein